MNYNRAIRAAIAALTLGVASLASPGAHANSEAFEVGYQMGAFFWCPHVYKYSTMPDWITYSKTREYNRGYAALKAALKGPHPSKVCFDAARASGWFNAG